MVLAFQAFLTEDTTMRRLVNTDEPEAAVDEYTNGQAYADLDAAITAAGDRAGDLRRGGRCR